jgi:hypothetical protein
VTGKLREVVEFLMRENRKSPRQRQPRATEDALTADLSESEANQLVEFASEFLRVACGRHGYSDGELHDMLPHGSPELDDVSHGNGPKHDPAEWEAYYYPDR